MFIVRLARESNNSPMSSSLGRILHALDMRAEVWYSMSTVKERRQQHGN